MIVPGRTEDIGFFTSTMFEKEFAKKCETLGDMILSKVRVEA